MVNIASVKPNIKLGYVNALRGMAILGVIFVHNGEHGPDMPFFPAVIQRFIDQGARGVQLFFVASAFTLFLSMSRRKVEKKPIRNFFIRRFFRIAPMYYLGIAFYSFWYIFMQPHPVTLANVLANVTFMHGINPYWINSLVPGGWSITVEMWFYCLAPWLFIKLKTVNQTLRFIAFGILINCIISIICTPLHVLPEDWRWASYLFLYFPSQLPVFGFGILLYLIIFGESDSKHVSSYTWSLISGTAIFVLMTGFGNAGQNMLGIASEGQHYWFGAAFFLLALGLNYHSSSLLVNRIINYIGEISFSLYLVHFGVLFALEYMKHSAFIHPSSVITALADFGVRYLVVTVVSIVIATIFYRLVELPFQNVGKKLIVHFESEVR